MIAASNTARWPDGSLVLDLEPRVLRDLLAPHLHAALRLRTRSRDRPIVVPSASVVDWIPDRLAVLATQAGVDLATITATIEAQVRAVTGGVEMTVDVTPLLRAAVEQLQDRPELATYFGQLDSYARVTVRDLGTVETVELPPVDRVSDEPWD